MFRQGCMIRFYSDAKLLKKKELTPCKTIILVSAHLHSYSEEILIR